MTGVKEILASKQAAEDQLQTANLLSLLYATIEAPEAWTEFLCATAALFGARGAQIIHQDMRDFRLSFTAVSGYNWKPETYAAYAALIPEDPRLAVFLERPGQAVHCRMQMTDAEYHQSRIYREVLRDEGVEYACGVNFGENRQHISGMILLRDQSQPPFSAEDCERLHALVPHIRRVLTLHGYIGRLELENRISHDTLDALGAGVIVIDKNGKIEIANKAARTLLTEGDNIRDIAGRLHCETRNGETLDDILRLVRSSHNMHPFEILRDCGDPLLAFMTPDEADHGRFDPKPLRDDGAVIVIRTSDLRQDPAAQARVLELLWKLTPSQASLACLLGNGETLQSSATKMGITEASARQYLKVVFRKLDVNRQSDVLRKVTSVLVTAKPN
jgi:DNA-binding CsgD family transcriptional regulator